TSLFGLPREFLTSRKPSPPAPPDLLITTIDCFIRLCLETMPCTVRAIWSAPPPGPAGTMISTVRLGSHAAVAAANGTAHSTSAAPSAALFSDFDIGVSLVVGHFDTVFRWRWPGEHCLDRKR